MKLRVVRCLAALLLMFFSSRALRADKWQPIDPAELKMTGMKEAPGASAVILYKEQITDDTASVETEYYRVKILTEAGRKYADVDLRFLDKGKRVTDISGRTIHPDGSIVNFDGKVFTKDIVKGHGIRYSAKTFTLPNVTVGSVIEYRYTRRWDEHLIFGSFWEVQDLLFTKRAKFLKKEFEGQLGNVRGTSGLRWSMRNLPEGEKVKLLNGMVALEVTNVPAFEREENMPPQGQLMQSVLLYYGGSDLSNPAEFWRNEGKEWAKTVDQFVGHAGTAQSIALEAAPANLPPDQRLRKIYDRAQKIRNLSFEHGRSDREAKQENLSKDNNNAGDVLKHDYGYRTQINRTFIALARAAGFEANAMRVAERDQTFFDASILTSAQLDREIAVVRVGDKDVYLDPGTKYCPYGILDWKITSSAGMRQIKGGDTKLEQVPSPDYHDAITGRRAVLNLDAEGNISGPLVVQYLGVEALMRRLEGRDQDDAAHKTALEEEVRNWFPANSEVKLVSLSNWEAEDQPISATFDIKVAGFATSTGSRLFLPTSVFANTYKRTFDHEQRKYPVYFNYPYAEVDEVFIRLPKGVEVENLPKKQTAKTEFAAYIFDRTAQLNTIHLKSQIVVAGLIFPTTYYPKLRAFFSNMKNADEEQVLLKSTETSSLGATDAQN